MDRRSALKLIGGAAAGVAISPRMLAPPAPSSKYALVPTRPYSSYGQSLPQALRALLAGSDAPSLAFQTVRTADMVYLGFELYNAKTEVTAGQTEIVAKDTKLPIYMVVVFPSQHLGEECGLSDEPSDSVALEPAQGCPSRVQLAGVRVQGDDQDPLHDGWAPGLVESDARTRTGRDEHGWAGRA
jgi:hypothetical protein